MKATVITPLPTIEEAEEAHVPDHVRPLTSRGASATPDRVKYITAAGRSGGALSALADVSLENAPAAVPGADSGVLENRTNIFEEVSRAPVHRLLAHDVGLDSR